MFLRTLRFARCWSAAVATLVLAMTATAEVPSTRPDVSQRPRVLVLTDISNEPDDEESLVRFLVYSNEYEVEGLVATTSCRLRNKTREDLIRRDVDAYGQVRDNLLTRQPAAVVTTPVLTGEQQSICVFQSVLVTQFNHENGPPASIVTPERIE